MLNNLILNILFLIVPIMPQQVDTIYMPLNDSPLVQQADTTSMIKLQFNESMNGAGLFTTSNYSITDEKGKTYKIYKVGVVKSYNGFSTGDSSLVALITAKLPYRMNFTVRAFNLKDKAGNLISGQNTAWFFYNGYDPSKMQTPVVHIKK